MKPDVHVTLFGRSGKGKNEETTTDSKEIDWDVVGQKAAIVQETAETVAKVFAVTYVAKKLVDTACEIAVIVAKAKL